jgi:hypothetical protein
MDEFTSLNMAIDLVRTPSQVRLVRQAPLPDGVLTLLRIAARDEEATNEAISATGRSRETVREAAAFFIEQILFCPEADSYRVLGARPEASNRELRHNMALLLRWLHPDHDPQGERSVFAGRVTRAWNDLKTQERRAAYDQSRRIALLDKSLLRKKPSAQAKKQVAAQPSRNNVTYRMQPGSNQCFKIYPERAGLLRQVLLLLLGKVVR